MAERKRSASRSAQSTQKKKRPAARKRNDLFAGFRRSKVDFRPDAQESAFLKSLHLTRQQRQRMLRWGLYILVCILALVIQDVIMSRIHIFGATTDLPVAAIMLISILEGSEVGSVYAMLSSIIYHFSGSAPGPYCVGLITVPALLCSLFRQKFWHRSSGSIILCASIALLVYEVGLYVTGLFLGLTRWDRIVYFLLTAAYSIVIMIPLYQLIYKIGRIGGHTWKE